MQVWATHTCAGTSRRFKMEERTLIISSQPLFTWCSPNKSSFPEWEVHVHKSRDCLKIPWLKFLEIESIWRDIPQQHDCVMNHGHCTRKKFQVYKGVRWSRPFIPTETLALVSGPQRQVTSLSVGHWLLTSSRLEHLHLWLFLQLKRKKKEKEKGKKRTSAQANIILACDLKRTSLDVFLREVTRPSSCWCLNIIISSQKGKLVWFVGKVTCPISVIIASLRTNPSEYKICGVFDFLSINLGCLLSF